MGTRTSRRRIWLAIQPVVSRFYAILQRIKARIYTLPNYGIRFELLESRQMFSGTGLVGTYYNNSFQSVHALVRTDPTINFDWGSAYPDSSITTHNFSVRWMGQVEAQYSEQYTFYADVNDGVRLWVNGQEIINQTYGSPGDEWSGTINLQAGQKYNITMDYTTYSENGNDQASLLWSSASQAKEVIPEADLYAPNTPIAPQSLSASAYSPTEVVVSWNGGQGSVDATGEIIQQEDVATGTYTTVDTIDGSYDGGAVFDVSGGLSASNEYVYRVISTNSAGDSDPSPSAEVSLSPEIYLYPPNAPAGSSLTMPVSAYPAAITGDSVTNQWSVFYSGSPYDLPSGVSTTSSTLTFTPPMAGLWSIDLTATDTALGTTASSSIGPFFVSTPSSSISLDTTPNDQQVGLSWSADSGAAYYNIYRSTSYGSGYVLVNSSPITSTNYTDTGLTNDTLYYYIVASVNASGQIVNNSQADYSEPYFNPPANVQPSTSDHEVSLQWNSAASAVSYNVYRSTTSGSGYELVNSSPITTTGYNDTGLTDGTTYYYVVTAVDSNGNESPYSSERSAIPALQAPSPWAYPGDQQVDLYWSSVDGAVSYNVCRSTTSGSGYELVNSSPITDTSYTDTGLTNGTAYYYVVTAVDANGNESADSNELAETPALYAPNNIRVQLDYGMPELNWQYTIGATSYNIYRSTTDGSGYELITNSSYTSYVDSNVTNGVTYFYVVTAVDGNGNESPFSSQVSETPVLAQPIVSTETDYQQVELFWNPPNGATSYNIYRSTTSGSGYTLVNDNPLTGDSDSYTDTGLTNGTTYYYVITAYDSVSSESATSDEVSAVPEVAPVYMWSTGVDDGEVGLMWAPSTFATLYNLYRSTTSGGPYEQINSTPITTQYYYGSYLDSGLTNGTTYYYVVTAVDDSGNESPYSNEVAATPNLSPPDVSAVGSNQEIQLSWDTPDNAVSYNVYRSTTSGGNYQLLNSAPITDNSHTDTNVTAGTTYYYVVTSVDADGNESPYSSEIPVAAELTAPVASANVDDQQVELNWDSVFGATTYNVYRSTTSGSGYELVNSSPITDTSYTDTGLTNGATYYYVVTAVDIDGNESADSNELAETPTFAAPSLEANPDYQQVDLDWSGVDSAVSYNVYRSTTSGSGYELVNSSPITDTSYTDTGLTNGTTYYYVVKAVDADGNESSDSNEQSATPTLFAPSPWTSSDDQQVSIYWSSTNGAVSYNVYRSTTSGSGYELVNSSPITDTSYTDTGLTNGTTYYYVVTAVDSDGNESAYSNEQSATPTFAAVSLWGNPDYQQVELQWSYNSDAVSYNVYRSTTSGSGYQLVNSAPITDQNYTDTGLTNGTTYYYVVTAVDANGNESTASDEVALTPALQAPSPGGEADAQEVDLQWSPTNGAVAYNVYRSTTSGSGYELLNSSPITGTSYVDTNVTRGTDYYYVLTAIDAQGNESAYSSEDDFDADIWPPSLETEGTSDHIINLSWSSTFGAVSYNVYRSTTSGSGYELVNSSPITDISFSDTTVDNNVTYYYVVTAVDSTGNESGYSNEVNAVANLWPPSPWIDSSSDHTIGLSWWPTSGAVSYNVYRSTISGGGYELVNSSPITDTSFSDTTADNNVTYYYVVTAVDSAGTESDYSNEVSGSAEFVPPSSLNVTGMDNSEVDLVWSVADAATVSYNVYRSTSADDDFELLNSAPVTGTSYVDTNVTQGTTYYYQVTGVDGSGGESDPSNQVSATAELAAPNFSSSNPDDNRIEFQWNTVFGAAYYNLYRSTTSGSGYSLVNSSPIWSPYYTDTGLTDGTTYYYVVTAVDAQGNESAYSLETSNTPEFGQVNYLSASPDNQSIELSWGMPAGATSFTISRSTDGTNFETIDTETSVSYGNYTDTGLTNGPTYYYMVTVTDAAGNSQSAETSATPELQSPYFQVYGESGQAIIQLYPWSNPNGAVAYNVYRSTTSGSGYELVNSSPINIGESYTDTGLTDGTTYYYVLTSVDAQGNESGYSSEVQATAGISSPLSITTVAGEGEVNLNWDSSPGAVSYNIYRAIANDDDSSFQLVNSSPINGNSYLDTGLTDGANYVYAVTAVDADGNESAMQELAYATPTPPQLTVSGPSTIAAGQLYTLNLSAQFGFYSPDNVINSWTINWGDGTQDNPDLQVVDSDASSVTHVYSPSGNTYSISATATDQLGTYSAIVNFMDSSFGSAGLVVTTTPSSYGYVAATQSGSNIVTVGNQIIDGAENVVLQRYTSAGVPDTTFGDNGVSQFSLGSLNANVTAITAQQDGKLLVAVAYGAGDDSILRFNSDGSLDTSFGDDGVVTTPWIASQSSLSTLTSLSDGFLVSGTLYNQNTEDNEVLLARYNSDGSIDSSFGNNGYILLGLPASSVSVNSIIVQSDGKIVIAGTAYNSNIGVSPYFLARFNADGTQDTTFGQNGVVIGQTLGYIWQVSAASGPNGNITVAGYANEIDENDDSAMVLAQYNNDGQLNSSFGSDGVEILSSSEWAGGTVSLLIQSDGKIVLVGTGDDPDDTDYIWPLAERFNTDGTLDDTFADAGNAALSSGSTYGMQAVGGILQPNGIVVIAENFSGPPNNSIALAQILFSNQVAVTSAAPTNLQATANDGQVSLTWSAATDDDSYYNIYRSTTSGSGYVKINANPVTDTAYTDAGLTDGTNYYYVVTAVDGDGNETAYSTEVSATPAPFMAFISGDPQVAAGETYTLNLSADFLDGAPDGDAITSWTINWGDGTGDSLDLQTVGDITSVSHVYSYNADPYLITGTATDAVGTNAVEDNAQVDLTYGTNGQTVTQFTNETFSDIQTAVFDSSGNILVATIGYDQDNNSNVVIARYNPDGSLDTTYGSGGSTITSIDLSSFNSPDVIALQPGGKILIAGDATDENGNDDYQVIRYNSDGSIDTTFGTNGIVQIPGGGVTNQPVAMTLQPDGKIILLGANYDSDGEPTNKDLIRLNSDGTLDTSFGTGGIVSIVTSGELMSSVTVDQQGGILVAGGSGGDADVIRFNSDGSLDTSFGNDGWVSQGTDIRWLKYVAVQSDGQILVAGASYSGTFSIQRFNTVLPDFDMSLGVFARAEASALPTAGLSGILVQPDGKVIGYGLDDSSSTTSGLALIRYNLNDQVRVDPPAPTITISGDSSVAAGATYILNLSAEFPEGPYPDVSVQNWTINWGDGTESDPDLQTVSGDVTSVTHTFNYSTTPISVTAVATDIFGSFASQSPQQVSVTPLAPTSLTIGGDSTAAAGVAYTLNVAAAFPDADAGQDALSSLAIDWGDGSGTQTITGNPMWVTHEYSDSTTSATISAVGTDLGGNQVTSNDLDVTVVPAPPTDLTETVNTPRQVTLNWTNRSTTPSGLQIEVSNGGSAFEVVGEVDSSATSYVVNGLNPNEEYYFRIDALNEAGLPDYSDQVSVTMPSAFSGTALLTSSTVGTPENYLNGWVGYSFTTGSSGLIMTDLGRMVVQGNSQSHIVKIVDADTGQDVAGAQTTVNASGTAVGQVAYAALASPVTLLANHTYYLVSQESFNGDAWYANSTIATTGQVTINGTVEGTDSTALTYSAYPNVGYGPVDLMYSTLLPSAPTNLAASSGTGNVTLTWSGGTGATTFEIERKSGPNGVYSIIGTVDGSTSEYEDDNLTVGPTYYYRVIATNAAGDSSNSSEAQATPTQTPTFSDNFNRMDSSTLGSSWDSDSFAISSDTAVSAGSDTSMATVTDVDAADVSVSADINLADASEWGQTYEGVVARVSDSGTYYMGRIFKNYGDYQAQIILATSQWTVLASADLGSAVPSGTLTFTLHGSAMSLYFNGALAVSAQDSTITAAGSAGLFAGFQGAHYTNFNVVTQAAPEVATTQLPFSDNFIRPDSPDLGSYWTTLSGGGGFAVNDDAAVSNDANGSAAIVDGAEAADVSVSAYVDLSDANAHQFDGLLARYTSGNSYYFGRIINNVGVYAAEIVRADSSGWTLLISNFLSYSPPSGTLRFDLSGSTLNLYFNNSLVATTQDSEISGPGAVGLITSYGATFKDFAASDLASSTTDPEPDFPSDNFNRIEGDGLGGNWLPVTGQLVLSDDQVISPSSSMSDSLLEGYSTTDAILSLDYSKNSTVGIDARVTSSGQYRAVVSGGEASIMLLDNGAWTTLTSASTPQLSGTMQFALQGTSLAIYINGVPVVTTTDSTFQDAGSVGIMVTYGSADNFAVSAPDAAPDAQNATLPFSDDFNRANSTVLSSYWTVLQGTASIDNDSLETLAQADTEATLNGVTQSDVTVSADVDTSLTAGTVGLEARVSDGNGYRGEIVTSESWNGTETYQAQILAENDGEWYTIASNPVNLPRVNGRIPTSLVGNLRFDVIGSSQALYFNGQLVCSSTDSSVADPGMVGVYSSDSVAIDNFSASELAAPTPQDASLPFSDDFSRADNDLTLGTSWVKQSGDLALQSDSIVNMSSGISVATLQGIDLTDEIVGATVNLAEGQTMGLVARYTSDNGGSYYGALIDGDGNVQIIEQSGDETTQLATGTVDATSGALRFEVVGTNLLLFFNNSLVISAVDSSLATGSVGIVAIGSGSATLNAFNAVQAQSATNTVLTLSTASPAGPQFWQPGLALTNIMTGDFTGNGNDDVVGYDSATGNWLVGIPQGEPGYSTQVWGNWSTSTTWTHVMVGDFNGDGLDDIAGYNASTGQWEIALSNGSSFSTATWATWTSSDTYENAVVGDFNGDGRSDIAAWDATSGSWVVAQSNGTSFQTSVWGQGTAGASWESVVVGDFNGDGRSDLAAMNGTTGAWHVEQSTGTSFVDSVWTTWSSSVSWTNIQAADFNGDGRTDLIAQAPGSPSWQVALSTGSSFTNENWGTQAGTLSNLQVGDFNGDGMADLVGQVTGTDQWRIETSTGSGFTDAYRMTTTAANQVQGVVTANFDSLAADALKDFETVYNTIQYELYAGEKKGPTATQETGSGNDWDQAALLIQMLRADGIQAQFVFGRISVPTAQVEAWLGVKDLTAVMDALGPAGLNPVIVNQGESDEEIQFDHAWVQALLPGPDGLTWQQMDPSFKFQSQQTGVGNLYSTVPFDQAGFLSQNTSETPLQYYENQIEAYLAANGGMQSIADVPSNGPIIAQQLKNIPTMLPYTVVGATNVYDSVPDIMTDRVEISLQYIEPFSGPTPTLIDYTAEVPNIALDTIAITYTQLPDGGYSPELRINGVIVQADNGDYSSRLVDGTQLGDTMQLTITHYDPGSTTASSSTIYQRLPGTTIAIGLDADQYSNFSVAALQQQLNNESLALATGQTTDPTQALADGLSLSVMKYFLTVQQDQHTIDGLFQLATVEPTVGDGVVDAASNQVFYDWNSTVPVVSSSMEFDIRGPAPFAGTPTDGNDGQVDDQYAALQLMDLDASMIESNTLESVAGNGAISTITGLQYAATNGIPVLTITSANEQQMMDELTVPTSYRVTLENYLDQGATVIMPRDLLSFSNWSGTVMMVEFPQSSGQADLSLVLDTNVTNGARLYALYLDMSGFFGDFPQGASTAGDPVIMATGSFTRQDTDVSIPNVGFPLEFTRQYVASSQADIGLGEGWTDNYGDTMLTQTDGEVIWKTSEGNQYTFTPNGDGGFTDPAGTNGTLTIGTDGYVYADTDGTTRYFNATGRLEKIEDRNGNSLVITYDSDGDLESVSDGADPSRDLIFTSTSGHITSMTDFTGRTWTYTYQTEVNPATGQMVYMLTSCTAPSDSTTPADATTYSYSLDGPLFGLMTSIADSVSGKSIRVQYYPNGQAFSVTDPQGNTEYYYYNSVTDTATYVNALGQEYSYQFDSSGDTLEEIDPDLTTIASTWSNGLLQSRTNQMDQTESFTYDSNGNVTQSIAYDGVETDAQYNSLNLLTEITVSGEGTTTLTYDSNGNLTSTTDAMGDETTMTYNSHGEMTSITDPDGNVADPNGNYTTTFTYNEAGQVLSETTGLPSTISYTYDDRGDQTSSTDATGHTTDYSYDVLDRLVSVTGPDPDGSGPESHAISTVEYNPAEEETTSTDPLGNQTQTYYDGNSRVVKVVNADGTFTTNTYDAVGNLIAATDERGNVTQYIYNSDNELIETLLPNGSTTSATYNANGQITSVTDADGNNTAYAYQSNGWLSSVTNALGQTTSYTYDSAGNVLTMTDSTGTTTYTYDSLGRVTQMRAPGGIVTTTDYDPNGNVIDQTVYDVSGLTSIPSDPRTLASDRKQTTTYSYDVLNRPIEVTDPDGNHSFTTYDAAGRVLSTTDGNGNTTTYAYDDAGRLISTTAPDPDGSGPLTSSVTEYQYDADNNLIAETDPNGDTTTYAYNDLNELVSTAQPDPDGSGPLASPVTTYQYNVDGQQTAETDPDGNTTFDTYNNVGELVKTTNAAGSTSTYQYDGNGNLISTTDADGRTINYTYNALGQVTSENWMASNGTTVLNSIQYTYNDQNQLQTVSDGRSSYSYTYTDAGQVASVSNAGTPNVPTVVLNDTYDGFGNQSSLSASVAGTTEFTNDYQYDPDGQMTQVTQTGSNLTSKEADFTYNADGQFSSMTLSAAGSTVATAAYGYDNANRLTSLTYKNSINATIDSYTLAYDPDNWITQRVDGDGTTNYTYDNDGQLMGATGSALSTSQSYSYDANGNQTATGDTTGTNNQLTSDGTYDYTYDADGNLITMTTIATGATENFTWDYRNRLTEVTYKNADGTTTETTQYTYDVYNRRISQTVTNGSGEVTLQENYVYDGSNLVMVIDGSSNATHTFLNGPTGQALADDAGSGNVTWMLTDQQGSVGDVVNDSGTVVDHIKYDSYGNILSQSSPSNQPRFAYAGMQLDSATGLYYDNARYYDASQGRFLSTDPLGFGGGNANLYGYVSNDPINLADPTGMSVGLTTAKKKTPTQIISGNMSFSSFGDDMSSTGAGMSAPSPAASVANPAPPDASSDSMDFSDMLGNAMGAMGDLSSLVDTAALNTALNLANALSSLQQPSSNDDSSDTWSRVNQPDDDGPRAGAALKPAGGSNQPTAAQKQNFQNQLRSDLNMMFGATAAGPAINALMDHSLGNNKQAAMDLAIGYGPPIVLAGAGAGVGMMIDGSEGAGSMLIAAETPAATTTVYRAVSNAEYQSILDTGQFTQGPNSLEGKWFADTLEGAQLHGDALHGPGNYQIIQADVPNDAPSLFQQPNLDGRGPARYLDLQDLLGVQPTPVGGN